MTVLDAYAVIAYLRNEPAAAEVEVLLRDEATLTTIGVAEVIDQLVRVHMVDEDEAVADLAQLGLLDGHPLSPRTAVRAGLLRARRYHGRRAALSMADCVVAETSRELGRPVATADPHLLDVCHAESIPTVPLVDRAGRRWQP